MAFPNPGVFHSSDNFDYLNVLAQIHNPQPYSNFTHSDLWEERTVDSPNLGSISTTPGGVAPSSPNA